MYAPKLERLCLPENYDLSNTILLDKMPIKAMEFYKQNNLNIQNIPVNEQSRIIFVNLVLYKDVNLWLCNMLNS